MKRKFKEESVEKYNHAASPFMQENVQSSPCGVCLNWQDESSFNTNVPSIYDKSFVEVVVGAKGIIQGTHPKTIHDDKRCTSRLSRETFRENIMHAIDALTTSQLKLSSQATTPYDYRSLTYQQLKHSFALKKARENRQHVLLSMIGPLGTWLTTDEDGDYLG